VPLSRGCCRLTTPLPLVGHCVPCVTNCCILCTFFLLKDVYHSASYMCQLTLCVGTFTCLPSLPSGLYHACHATGRITKTFFLDPKQLWTVASSWFVLPASCMTVLMAASHIMFFVAVPPLVWSACGYTDSNVDTISRRCAAWRHHPKRRATPAATLPRSLVYAASGHACVLTLHGAIEPLAALHSLDGCALVRYDCGGSVYLQYRCHSPPFHGQPSPHLYLKRVDCTVPIHPFTLRYYGFLTPACPLTTPTTQQAAVASPFPTTTICTILTNACFTGCAAACILQRSVNGRSLLVFAAGILFLQSAAFAAPHCCLVLRPVRDHSAAYLTRCYTDLKTAA